MSGWHTYGLEWGPGYQIYNIDGVRTNMIFGGYVPTTAFYILLNSGIESARPPQPGTTFPNDFAVDWVRVYSRPDSPALINGDFESDEPNPWQFKGEASVGDFGAHSGNRCLRLDSSAVAPASAHQTIYGLKSGSAYVLTAFVKSGGGKAAIKVADVGSDSGAPISQVAAENNTTLGKYAPLRVTFTTGPKATSVVVTCSAEAAATAFFDDLAIAAILK